jgi:hypothetical protein
MKRWIALVVLFALAAPVAAQEVDPDLLAKAQTYDEQAQLRHVPAYGGFVQNVYTDTNYTDILFYRGQGDSTMWTGTYAVTQAFRYAASGDPAAKANAVAAIQALRDHVRVTQTTGYVGRYVGPLADEAFWLDVFQLDEFRVGEGLWIGTFWLSNSSSDQYVGFFHAMGVVFDLVDDPATRLLIRNLVQEVVDKLRNSFWLILDEDGLPTTAAPQISGGEKIAIALIAAHVIDTPEYWALYDDVYEEQKPSLAFNATGFWNRYTEYFAMNLKHQNYYNVFRLEPDLDRLQFIFDIYIDKVWRWVKDSHQVYFDYVYLTGCSRLNQCEGSFQIMDDGVASLHKFTEWPNTQIFITPPPAEVDPVSQWLVDFQAGLPAFIQDLLGFEIQAADAYDLDNRCRVEYMWQRSPYMMSCGPIPVGWPEHMLPGADYLMAYWMGRHLGYLSPHDLDPPGDDDDDDTTPAVDDDDDNDDTPDDDDTPSDDDTTPGPSDDDDDGAPADDDDDDDDEGGCGC